MTSNTATTAISLLMSDEERRADAWNNAVHADGTGAIFNKRADSYRMKTKLRDFYGFAVPIIIAFLFTGELTDAMKTYRHDMLIFLGIAGMIQVLIVLWSILSKWDEELAYSVAASGRSYIISQQWKKLGQGNTNDIRGEYERLFAEQERIDIEDSKKGITKREKQFGVRAGLLTFDRQCVCGFKPESANIPFRVKHPCMTCGGN